MQPRKRDKEHDDDGWKTPAELQPSAFLSLIWISSHYELSRRVGPQSYSNKKAGILRIFFKKKSSKKIGKLVENVKVQSNLASFSVHL